MDKMVLRKKFRRVTALILAAVTILSMFFALPVSAKTGDSATITFDYCYDTGGGIITFAKTVRRYYHFRKNRYQRQRYSRYAR